jgi:uncharacterized protein Yka (UPF0111/DUF47 family)
VIYKALRKEDAFFSVFGQLATLSTQTITELRRLFDNLPVSEADAQKMTEMELQGDNLQIDLNLRLAKSFITPLDREDIHHLAKALKAILDCLHGTAHRAVYLRVSKAPQHALELIDLATGAIASIDEAVRCLQKGQPVDHLRKKVMEAERQGDQVSRKAIGEMFEQRVEIYELLKWKELYERLEAILDRCEDGFLVVETLSVKYA